MPNRSRIVDMNKLVKKIVDTSAEVSPAGKNKLMMEMGSKGGESEASKERLG